MYLQDSQTKYTEKSNLSALRHAEFPNHQYGKDDDDEVGSDVVPGIAIPEFGKVDTRPLDRLVIRKLDWDALEYRHENAGDGEAEHDTGHAPA